MNNLIASLVLAWLPLSGFQNTPCKEATVPVSVVFPDQRNARGLTAEHFIARVQRKRADLDVAPDSGPRRILLLIDLSKKMNDDIWQAALAAATHVVEKARLEDQIGLLTFGGPRIFLGWGEPRSVVLEKLAELLRSRPGPAEAEALVRDALDDSLALFSPPQFGDAIFLLFPGEDTGSRISIERLQGIFSQSHVRILGMVFGILYHGSSYWSRSANSAPIPNVDYGNPFYNLVADSGGAIMVGYSGHPQRSFKLTPELEEQLRTTAWRLYGQIVETYKVKVVLPASERVLKWELEVSAQMKKKFPGLLVRKPNLVARCWAN